MSRTKYKYLEKVGEGVYGTVYKVKCRDTEEIYAVKKIRMEHETEGFPASSLREVSILKKLNHNSVVKLIEIDYNIKDLRLVFEFIDSDLEKYIERVDSLSPMLIKSYMYQLADGLNYCHSLGVLHRDLKPANILIDEKGTLKIADFGLSRKIGLNIRPYTQEILTLWYRSPENSLGTKFYSYPVDIWSVGCIFAEMLTMKPIFSGKNEIEHIYEIFKILGTPNDEIWEGVNDLSEFGDHIPKWEKKDLKVVTGVEDNIIIDLLEKMFIYNPKHRISANDILENIYFDELFK